MSTEPKNDEEPFADLIVGLRAAVPELDPSPSLLPDLRRHYARRTALRRAAYAAVPVAVVAAVGVGAMLIPRDSASPQAAAPTSAHAPVVHDAAQVAAQVAKALTDADHDILAESWTSESDALGLPVPKGQPMTSKAWVSMATGDRRAVSYVNGKEVFEAGRTKSGEFTVINYFDNTYDSWPAGQQSSTAPVRDTFTPDQIKSAMAKGELSITAQNQQIDGQSTIELTGKLIPSDESGPYAKAVPQRFWVNSTTYLPVRRESQDSKGNWAGATDFTWLAPTPENQALLPVTVPQGVTKIK
jgi:hypothetical protein